LCAHSNNPSFECLVCSLVPGQMFSHPSPRCQRAFRSSRMPNIPRQPSD
jgi:hypothetical protein